VTSKREIRCGALPRVEDRLVARVKTISRQRTTLYQLPSQQTRNLYGRSRRISCLTTCTRLGIGNFSRSLSVIALSTVGIRLQRIGASLGFNPRHSEIAGPFCCLKTHFAARLLSGGAERLIPGYEKRRQCCHSGIAYAWKTAGIGAGPSAFAQSTEPIKLFRVREDWREDALAFPDLLPGSSCERHTSYASDALTGHSYRPFRALLLIQTDMD